MKQVQVRDEKGHIFNTLTTPAVVFDKEAGVMHKIGEYDDMKTVFDMYQQTYRSGGFDSMADSIVLLELPLDQELIDNIFQNTGYIGNYYREFISTTGVVH
ncbi:hypothetical protein JMA_39910 (plasmid) [Jeotgalibacillus malaysiensis]|uniref:Uncharacterized protein n=1 Tax=Jeotgalibacillus malaysiensis TaxID=1508404 RepID=A0A0B5AZG6_9BACL|nr:hypothetical protein [Jeotgalibacillus malaysiensis]AJD93309.1 hypothetical protein JMA_39910 [Jeotgalibacillus malaysiensis]